MTAKKRSAGAVWQSNKKGGGATAALPETTAKAKKIKRDARFVEPQLTKLVEQPPSGPGWAHEVKFDGYRLQLRVEDGKATLSTRKGLDWTDKFSAIADAAEKLPDCMIDGEACALDKKGAPDFAAPAGGTVRRQLQGPDLLRLRPDVRRRRGPAAAAARRSARRG